MLLQSPGLDSGYAQPRHNGYMRLNLKMGSACLALLDDRSDHCLETLAVTLQVDAPLLRVPFLLSKPQRGLQAHLYIG